MAPVLERGDVCLLCRLLSYPTATGDCRREQPERPLVRGEWE